MFVQIKIMLYFSIILMYNERERIFSFIHRKKGAIMSERQNAVELYLDEKDFKMKLNGVEVHRVKGFSIQCDAGHPLKHRANQTYSSHVPLSRTKVPLSPDYVY